MSLRSMAALLALLLLQLSACQTLGNPSDPALKDVQRRHDEMMMHGMGGGGGGGM